MSDLCRLGNAKPDDADAILEAVVQSKSLVAGVGSAQWRGRFGLDKEGQVELSAKNARVPS
jgi:hypothetical protein